MEKDFQVKEVIMICGFGCELTPGYKAYLEEAFQWAINLDPDIVFISGGRTNLKTHPEKTEAQVIYEYLKFDLPHVFEEIRKRAIFVLDHEDSIMFRDSIEYLKGYSEIEKIISHVEYFCFFSHSLKYAMHFLAQDVYGTYFGPIFPNSFRQLFEFFKQTFIALNLEMLAYMSKKMYKKQRERREQIIKNS